MKSYEELFQLEIERHKTLEAAIGHCKLSGYDAEAESPKSGPPELAELKDEHG